MTSFWLYKWPRILKFELSSLGIMVRGYCHMPKKHINVLKHIVYVQYGCRKQFDLVANLNHDVMTSCWLHKWLITPKYEPSSVGITIWGYCHIPMDSISICSNTFYMYDVDARSRLNHDVMTSFWLHKWPTTPKFEPISVGITVWGSYRMSKNSIWMCSNTLYMSNVDVGARQWQVWWLRT